jgi:putative Holliday junction resolvase
VRYLAIDLGDKRTGLAIGDSGSGVITPLEVLECGPGDELLRRLADRVDAEEVDEVVLGLPLNMDGTEGDPARAARAFGARLEALIGRPLRYQDERLTSYAADQVMARSGRTHKQKKRRRAAVAAAEILRAFLAHR